MADTLTARANELRVGDVVRIDDEDETIVAIKLAMGGLGPIGLCIDTVQPDGTTHHRHRLTERIVSVVQFAPATDDEFEGL